MLVDYLKEEEMKRINLLVRAIKFQQDIASPDAATQSLVLEIYSSNNTIPVVIVDNKGNPMFHKNLPQKIENNPEEIENYVESIREEYPPIELKFPDGNNQYVYYDHSDLLKFLGYSPYIVASCILLYLLFSFWFLRTIKKTDEGFVWAGLAKETAHQIGTPLSSMIGWIEILKIENPNMMGIEELSQDVERLKTISQRFSKIGSIPELTDTDIRKTVEDNFQYLKARISGKINFMLTISEGEYSLPHDKILLSWVIENLTKNAVDAMKGVGDLHIKLYHRQKRIFIDFRDTGMGMSKGKARQVFRPGFSTKKRGWGLGLSLAKRVVQEYHGGEIKIAHTEVGKGTVFRIVLKPCQSTRLYSKR